MNKTKILFAGLGGVGGYFGGLLAEAYQNSEAIEIDFFCRGAHLTAIRNNGIVVEAPQGTFHARPKLASDQAEDFKQVQYIFICCKAYDLDGLLESLKPAVEAGTIIIPLLNGVDSRTKIQAQFPQALVTDGCVNIVTRKTAPGHILCRSKSQKMHIGLQGQNDERLNTLEKILLQAGIDLTLTSNIQKAIWSKYLLISSSAAATTYFDCSFDELLEDKQRYDCLSSLLDEIIALAKAKHIDLASDAKEKTLAFFAHAPKGSTTSMHSDYQYNPQRTEIESLLGYVIKQSEAFSQLNPQTYKKIYQALKSVD